MEESTFLRRQGAKILSEANDLKRTPEALAREIGMEYGVVQKVIQGEGSLKEINDLIKRMGECYPIDPADLILSKDDTIHGVKIMKTSESLASGRIFNRQDRRKNRTPYYEYRDTAMSIVGPYKPEWIRMIRVVEDNDPANPDVAYNNGHLLHQMTFFVGPVNFYWEVNGKKYCEEMNTGDSNYITPFWAHSFSSRDPNQLALILAVTFGGDVRRAQKELYSLGERGKKFSLDVRNSRAARAQLLKQHLENEMMTIDELSERARVAFPGLDVKRIFNIGEEISASDLQKIASLLHIDVSDLLLPPFSPSEEVVVKHQNLEETYFYPSKSSPLYKINPLARAIKMPLMKGFHLEVLSKQEGLNSPLVSSLHSYMYNYGSSPVELVWKCRSDGALQEATLEPGDSAYLQPWIEYGFHSKGGDEIPKLCVFAVSGGVNFSTQKEMSFFPEKARLIETTEWFS